MYELFANLEGIEVYTGSDKRLVVTPPLLHLKKTVDHGLPQL